MAPAFIALKSMLSQTASVWAQVDTQGKIRAKKIKFIKDGNQYRFKKADVIGLVA